VLAFWYWGRAVAPVFLPQCPVESRPELLLASTSPRRRQLLAHAGIGFLLVEPGPEYPPGGDDLDPQEVGEPQALALLRARRKALLAQSRGLAVPRLGVDTVVELDGKELGKPRDRTAAEQMQRQLAGRLHRVHTAHVLVAPDASPGAGGWVAEEMCSATVACRVPAEAELRAYLDSGDWVGKAGAYGLQDASQTFLRLVEGEFDTVVGLHVAAVRRLLAAFHSR